MQQIKIQRIKQLLEDLKSFKHLKVIKVTGVTGPSFVAFWDAKLTSPISIEEAYKLNTIQYMRGVTLYLEDGTMIMSRIDVEFIGIYPKGKKS